MANINCACLFLYLFKSFEMSSSDQHMPISGSDSQGRSCPSRRSFGYFRERCILQLGTMGDVQAEHVTCSRRLYILAGSSVSLSLYW